MKLFMTSRMGLGINSGEGKRDTKDQSRFREELLKSYDSRDDTGQYAWCPIIHEYHRLEYVRAAHIFSYKHGQSITDEIFGRRSYLLQGTV